MDFSTIQFSKGELSQYNRHIIIPEFGLDGQKKLKAAKVLVVGSGGLGSPALLYLAAAGVGNIGILDYDVVEESNLHRQVLFDIAEIGLPKVDMAEYRLQKLNPYINIKTHFAKLTSENALSIIQEYDVIVDGTDNFPTRYLVNDACVMLGKPNVYASIFQFEGHVTVFNYRNSTGELGPNYRDLFSAPPPPGLVPNCAEGGVLGVLPGIIGSMQALEAIKVITGVGEVLSGRLFTFNALDFETKTFEIERIATNPLNGENPTIHKLLDYEQFCDASARGQSIKEISITEFLEWQNTSVNFQLIDVREPGEYEKENLAGELIPLNSILEDATKICRNKKVVIHCKSGGRSAKAIRGLEDKFGFNNLYNLKGGIDAFDKEVHLASIQKAKTNEPKIF